MTGVSGCFGGATAAIENLDAVSATVNEIVESANENGNSGGENELVRLYYYQSVEKRIRILTLAVVALSVVILAKEWK